jgi:hypothetical protein
MQKDPASFNEPGSSHLWAMQPLDHPKRVKDCGLMETYRSKIWETGWIVLNQGGEVKKTLGRMMASVIELLPVWAHFLNFS